MTHLKRKMLVWSHLYYAIQALRITKLRSALTMLGIIIGVAALIVVMAVGAGAKQQVMGQLSSLGTNLIIVLPGSVLQRGALLGPGSERSLSESDAEAIRREIFTVVAAAPIVFKPTQVVSGNRNWRTSVYGVTPDFLLAREWEIGVGRSFSWRELEEASKVALLGATVKKELFGTGNPLGQMVRIANTPFRIIGVLTEKGESPTGTDQDDKILIPLSTAKIRVLGSTTEGLHSIRYILVKVRDATKVDQTSEQVIRLLRQRHRILPGEPDDFEVRNLVDIQQRHAEVAGILGFWLTVIASVSLLVGGVSIMNIMLVGVTERTREIGLRLAVGARPCDIRHQFLIEAALLSFLGAWMGVALGVVTALAIGEITGLPIFVRPSSIVLATGFAVATGVFFGLFPAWRAARLDPITAIRVE